MDGGGWMSDDDDDDCDDAVDGDSYDLGNSHDDDSGDDVAMLRAFVVSTRFANTHQQFEKSMPIAATGSIVTLLPLRQRCRMIIATW